MQKENSLYHIPEYVVAYCKGRFTEIVEYLTNDEFTKLFRRSQSNPDIKIRVLESEKDSSYIRCLVTRRVLPLTVKKNPMLLRAAELEYKTYNGEFPMSIQEARWKLIDEWPETNCICQPISCHILIKEHRKSARLPLSDVIRMAKERRSKCIA